jgi:hypothetical protein
MYAAVPRITPAFVDAMLIIVGEFDGSAFSTSAKNAFANPKSSTFTFPSEVTLMLAAMNDALLVRGFQSFGNLNGNAQRLGHRNGAALDFLGQRRAGHQFHH